MPEIAKESFKALAVDAKWTAKTKECKTAMERFSQDEELTGKAYTKLKEYYTNVYPPLFDDVNKISAQLSSSNMAMMSQFQICVGSLEGFEADTDKLSQKIAKLTGENSRLEAEIQSCEARKKYYLYAALVSPVVSAGAIAVLEYKIRTRQKQEAYNRTIINKLERICRGIEAFNNKCSNLYDDAKDSIKSLKYTLYRKKVSFLGATRRTKQMSKYKRNGEKVTGICNFCAVEMLLNRRLNYDGIYNQEFDDNDMFDSLKCKNVTKVEGGYIYDGSTEKNDVKYINSDGTAYMQRTIKNVNKQMKENGTANYREYIASLLEKHPEGICIRSSYVSKDGGHAVLVTDYEVVDNKIQLYVQDPANNGRVKLENSYYGRNCLKKNGEINGIDWIKYLE